MSKYARIGFPRNAGRLAYAERVADAAAAAAAAEAEAAALAAAAAAAVEAAAAAAAVQRPLRVEDIPFVAPRGTPAAVHAPLDGEDAGYTPEPIEEDAPVRTSRLMPPERPTPTFISDPVPVVAARPSHPPPIRPVAGAPAPAPRPGFLPRLPAPAADVAAAKPVAVAVRPTAPIQPPVVSSQPAPASRAGFNPRPTTPPANAVPNVAVRPTSPSPVRTSALQPAPAPAPRPGFLPRPASSAPAADAVTPAADAAARRTGFSGLPRKAPAEPKQEEPAPSVKPKPDTSHFKNGLFLTVDDIPF